MTDAMQAHPTWRTRLMRALPVRIVIALAVILVPLAVMGALFKFLLPAKGFNDAKNIVATLVLFAVYRTYVRYIEKRNVTELGLRGALTETAHGLTVGLLLFSAVIGVLGYVGAYTVTGFNGWGALTALVPTFVLGAVMEELIFRAVIFRMIEESLGTVLALLISAVLFGAVHIANAGATFLTSAAIAIEAGLLLGAAYLLTRRLWLCIAIHFAWNISQGGIYSIAVSGFATKGVLQSRMTGPDWLTGGAFGAEASVVALGACSLVAAVMLLVAWKLGRFQPAPWRRQAG